MEYVKECNEKMDKSIEAIKASMASLRAGRVTPALLDKVTCDLYGETSPLKYGATITVISPTDLQVKPFDPSTAKSIIGGINKADLGCNVSQNGAAIILKFPAPSEDRRKDLIKQAKKYSEDGKVAIRNIRRDYNDKVKRDDTLSEDMKKNMNDDIQKATDKHIAEIEKILADKVKDIETI